MLRCNLQGALFKSFIKKKKLYLIGTSYKKEVIFKDTTLILVLEIINNSCFKKHNLHFIFFL